MSFIIARQLGLTDYSKTLAAMRSFTDSRDKTTPDEMWVLEHAPVYTQGQAGKPQHLLKTGNIPVIQSDRGGQVTYHGPGQLIIYLLTDLVRMSIGIKCFVHTIEQSMIDLLNSYGVIATRIANAPGVYVDGAKIGSLGVRVRKGRSYHGLSLNIDMDLHPFKGINPCGFSNMPVTQLKYMHPDCDMKDISSKLCKLLAENIGYNDVYEKTNTDKCS